jgi:hypothetical protein
LSRIFTLFVGQIALKFSAASSAQAKRENCFLRVGEMSEFLPGLKGSTHPTATARYDSNQEIAQLELSNF